MNSLGDISACQLRVVETYAAFDALEPDWNALEARDPDSNVFLSWSWSRRCFIRFPGRWRVLTLWMGDTLVGVLPLKYRVRWSQSRQEFQTEIEPGSRLSFSDYCGFLCDPKYESRVLESFAEALKTDPWVSITMKYGWNPRRAAVFSSCFETTEYWVTDRTYKINGGTTDNLASVRISLDDTFDSYLQTRLKPKLRKQIRQYERRYLQSGEMSFSWQTNDAALALLPMLMHQWRDTWEPIKGAAQATLVIETYTRYLTQAAATGQLRLAFLSRNNVVLGALAFITDPVKRRMHCIISSRDKSATGGFIGPLLHGSAIRWGIENGYLVYDFCHGDQDYKFRLGGVSTRLSYFTIQRRDLNHEGGNLDPICLPIALAELAQFIQSGEKEKSLSAARQLQQLSKATAPL